MIKLLLIEYCFFISMAREIYHYMPSSMISSSLALNFIKISTYPLEFICQHLIEPDTHIFNTISGRGIKFDHFLIELAEVKARQYHDVDEHAVFQMAMHNMRQKGSPRRYRHDADYESDGESMDYDRKCNQESCGDIVEDNGRYKIVAPWTGWRGKYPDMPGYQNYENDLYPGQSHTDAKNELCKMKGCDRCNISTKLCVSTTDDNKMIRKNMWIKFMMSHFLQYTQSDIRQ